MSDSPIVVRCTTRRRTSLVLLVTIKLEIPRAIPFASRTSHSRVLVVRPILVLVVVVVIVRIPRVFALAGADVIQDRAVHLDTTIGEPFQRERDLTHRVLPGTEHE